MWCTQTERFMAQGNIDHTMRRWAFSLYEQGSYSEAWAKVKRTRELSARPFPESFITALSKQQPEA